MSYFTAADKRSAPAGKAYLVYIHRDTEGNEYITLTQDAHNATSFREVYRNDCAVLAAFDTYMDAWHFANDFEREVGL